LSAIAACRLVTPLSEPLGIIAVEVAESIVEGRPMVSELQLLHEKLSYWPPSYLMEAATWEGARRAAADCVQWSLWKLISCIANGHCDFDDIAPGWHWDAIASGLAAEAVAASDPERAAAQLAENVALATQHFGPTAFRDHFFTRVTQGPENRVIFEGIDPKVTTEGGYLALATVARVQQRLANLLRDIFGNPFRPVTFSPSWRTDTAVSLARQMYDARDFSAMPILADALQDAGCDDDDILTHCRGPAPHVRGCWVCDLVLGKE
jgi:hypothetical protein